MATYLVVFIASALLAVFLTPLVVWIARRANVVDAPGLRKIHARAIPRLGGVAVLIPVCALCSAVFLLDNRIGDLFRSVQSQMLALLATTLAVFGVGLWDDVRGVSAKYKFLTELICAGVMCAAGVTIDQFSLTPSLKIHFGVLSIPLTILWIVGITNAVNLIDGLDGLAAGISLITCSVLAVIAMLADRPVMAVVMLAFIGSLSGFLVFNFNPAKIFLGDCGSLLLGYVLATTSIITSHKTGMVLALVLPLLALGIPILDTLFSILRRLVARRSLFSPDRSHIHHRLLDKGFDQRRVVLSLYTVTALVAGLGFLMVFTTSVVQLLFLTLALLFLVVVFRASGVISISDILQNVRHNQYLTRDARSGRRSVADAELRLREAHSLDAWWRGLCSAAQALGFSEMSLVLVDLSGPPMTWTAPTSPASARRSLSLEFQLRGGDNRVYAHVSGSVHGAGSAEVLAARGAILGMLLDRYASLKRFRAMTIEPNAVDSRVETCEAHHE